MRNLLVLLCLTSALVSCGNEKKTETEIVGNIDSKDLFLVAQQMHDLGNYDSALINLQSIAKVDSQNFKAKMLEGDVHWALRNYKESMAAYTTCLRWQNNNPIIWARLGKIYAEQNDFESALKYFNQSVNLDPTFADAYIGRAIVFMQKKEMEQAYLSLQTAIDFEPDNLLAVLKMAEWKTADSALVALQFYNNAIKIDSTQANSYFLRAKAHFKFAKYNNAKSDFEKAISLSPENLEYIFNAGYFYFQFEEYETALEKFNSFIKLSPKDIDAWLGKALCEKELDKIEEAKSSFGKMLEIDPNDEEALRELDNLR